MRLQMSTCLAENTVPATEAMAQHMSSVLNYELRFNNNLNFDARLTAIKAGEIGLSWLCGLLYIRLKESGSPLEPLLAPIFRYTADENAVYFSYVVTKKPNRFMTMSDCFGYRLAINERASFSGYEILRHYFAQQQKQPEFSEILLSGSHQASIELILDEQADLAAIDHSLYSFWAKRYPEKARHLSIIKCLGPFPSPPLVIHGNLDAGLVQALERTILDLPQALLTSWDLKGFQKVNDRYYDPIRQAVELGKRTLL